MLSPAAGAVRPEAITPELGLRANWRQFSLLVAVNGFVGAMVGLERTVVPLLAEAEFGIRSRRAALAFIASFGIAKAITNLATGTLSDRLGRKRMLLAGWLLGLPVPVMVMMAPSWSWIVAANVLLGANQGLTWSAAVIMKIDLVGPGRRGLALGLNEFAGYLAVAVMALVTGLIAERFGLRPEPFYLGIAIATAGLALSLLFVRDTLPHVRHEITSQAAGSAVTALTRPGLAELVRRTLGKDRALSSASQAGLVNNLNDGLAWGLFPLFFAAAGLSLPQIGLLAFVYPATWGVLQLVTGGLSDRIGRRGLVVGGMLVQGGALILLALTRGFGPWVLASLLLGVGTAMVYPTLLAVIGDVAQPAWRGAAVGIYRFWRDLGYAAGAVVAGVLADVVGVAGAILAIGLVTAASGLLVAIRMPETNPASGSGALR
jgi:MFS family permease